MSDMTYATHRTYYFFVSAQQSWTPHTMWVPTARNKKYANIKVHEHATHERQVPPHGKVDPPTTEWVSTARELTRATTKRVIHREQIHMDIENKNGEGMITAEHRVKQDHTARNDPLPTRRVPTSQNIAMTTHKSNDTGRARQGQYTRGPWRARQRASPEV